jgi:biopolymer transport protein ExbD
MSISIREARSIIRKAKRRVPEGEAITHLNITPMMDMMTILLVFMIIQATLATSPLNVKDLVLADSSSIEAAPEEQLVVTITKEAIVVPLTQTEDLLIEVVNGDVPASEKENGKYGITITRLKTLLGKHYDGISKKLAGQGLENPGELMIVADKETPYRLLLSVMYSAGQAKFHTFRMIVLRGEAAQQASP